MSKSKLVGTIFPVFLESWVQILVGEQQNINKKFVGQVWWTQTQHRIMQCFKYRLSDKACSNIFSVLHKYISCLLISIYEGRKEVCLVYLERLGESPNNGMW
jgi:hypothetical protein